MVAVRAQSEEGQTRRAVLGGVLAAAIAVAVPQQALAVSGLDILDGTKLRQSGFDIIYEARDLDLPQVPPPPPPNIPCHHFSCTTFQPRVIHIVIELLRAVHRSVEAWTSYTQVKPANGIR